MVTYFVRRVDGGPVKIGRAKNVRDRLRSMQSASPVALVCVAYIEGDWEAELHERFHRLCVGGEWFRADDELLAFIGRYANPAQITVPPLTPEQIAAKREARRRRWAAANAGVAKYAGRFKPRKAVPAWRTN